MPIELVNLAVVIVVVGIVVVVPLVVVVIGSVVGVVVVVVDGVVDTLNKNKINGTCMFLDKKYNIIGVA